MLTQKRKSDDNQYVHSLPPFANEVNKSLSESIKQLEAKLTALNATVDDNVSRSTAIKSHMKNVGQELTHTQALYDAKNRQIETEDHLKQLAEREAGRLNLEIKRVGTSIADMNEYLNMLQASIYRGNERIEVIRTELKLESDELNEWIRVQSEKEEDNRVLLKYSKEDEAKIKDLNHMIEKLMIEVNKRKAALNAEVTETQVAQIELDRTTEAFKQLHQERQDLINQWQEAVNSMQKRDEDIIHAQDALSQLKAHMQDTQNMIKEREETYNSQLTANKEVEKKITAEERLVAKFREEQAAAAANLQQYKNEVEVLKNTLNKSATELLNRKSELSNTKSDLMDRKARLEKSKASIEELKKRAASIDSETMSLEAKAEQLQEIFKKEEAREKAIDRTMKIVRENQFKKSQELFVLKQQERNFENEIQGGEASIRNLKAKIQKLDQEALKQRAMIYTMEFNIQQMERKVRRAEGDRTDEEKEILNKKIDQLQTQLDEVNAKYNLLNTQLKRSQEDLRHCKRRLDNLQRQRDNVLTNIEELNMYNESASHQLKALVKEREDVMVEESILRLELRKMRGFLNSRADEVYSLESRQVQLELALQERNKDINIHKDLLRVQIKNAEEERHSAAAELRERVGKVEKLKKRYEILMTQFAPEDDEEEHTQAYYVIKAAQKREELQKEGDSLDANIRRAEKEIKALENTLKMMNDRNEDFRMNLYQAELDSKDVQHKEMLDAEFRKIMDSFKSKRNHIQELQQQLSTLEQRLSSETGQETQHIQQLQLMQAKVQTTQRDIQDQTQKKQRALNAVQRYVKILRSQTADKTPEEMDILLRNLKDIGTIVLTELNKLMIHEADLVVPIKTLMAQIGIAQPSRVVSRASSRQSNVSQLSSRASSRQSMAVTKVPSAPRLSRDPAVPPLPAPTSRQGSQANVTGSQHKIPSVANINDVAGLPPQPLSRQGSSSSVHSRVSSTSTPLSKRASLAGSQVRSVDGLQVGGEALSASGPITGSGRIKDVTRPGSANSLSSRGSQK